MRQPTHNTAKLPKQLLKELGVSVSDQNGARNQRPEHVKRKEQRKASRVQKKTNHVPARSHRVLNQRNSHSDANKQPKSPFTVPQAKVKATSVQLKAPKSILKVPKSKFPTPPDESEENARSFSPARPAKLSKGVQDRLATDDAEIAALEKALGVRGKKKFPKAFEDDGLDLLLDDLNDAADVEQVDLGKRKRTEGEEWLEKKRRKAQAVSARAHNSVGSGNSEDESQDDEKWPEYFEDNSGSYAGQSESEGSEAGWSDPFEDDDEVQPSTKPTQKTRENPYVAPMDPSDATKPEKYIPPSLRNTDAAGSEELLRLRRQIQGLLNRLSEANLISILGDVEKLYREHPRQHVSTTLLDLLMSLLSDPTTLQDTFIILHAGFIAAAYKIVGTDFGAQAIHRIDEEFTQNYQSAPVQVSTGKKLINLMSLLAELYNFQVISSNLIYDFVRIFLQGLSETNTELLLKIIRNAGPQLRQDDPSSLKDIVLQLQTEVAKVGEENLSVRTKFMIETINNLKNNRMKTGIAASTITSEHTTRMKKALGSLNQRNIRASEPLRIGLKDLQDTEKRGKWWLVGASYKDDAHNLNKEDMQSQQTVSSKIKNYEDTDSVAADLVQLAREQRMNTDVRRSIFIAIISATDYNDAFVRLIRLRLKKSQELEIPKVLIQCAGSEKVYNPFYTFLSRRVCSDKKLKMSFQFSLWDLFKRMGEGDHEPDEDGEDEEEGKLGMRSLVNLARMFGVLVAEGGLGLGILKVFSDLIPSVGKRTF